jgi:mannosyl-oligosaccharide alpha-1,2-mannosidase
VETVRVAPSYHLFTDLDRSYSGDPEEAHSYTLSAELGSTSLEFTRLSQITGDRRYFDAVNRISNILEREQDGTKIPGLWPIAFDAKNETFKDETGFTMGGREDSMYEYVLKV